MSMDGYRLTNSAGGTDVPIGGGKPSFAVDLDFVREARPSTGLDLGITAVSTEWGKVLRTAYLQNSHAGGYSVGTRGQAVFPYRGAWASLSIVSTSKSPSPAEWRALIHAIQTAPTA
jgi:hypothetical protein